MHRAKSRLLFAVACLCVSQECRDVLAQTFTWNVVAKAKVDECYGGFGQSYQAGPTCSSGRTSKRNQSYLWSMANSGSTLWLGTGANVICQQLTSATIGATVNLPFVWVCEGVYSKFPGLTQTQKLFVGDWRRPQILRYNTSTAVLTDVTPNDARINSTAGMRAAGVHNGVVLFGGPTTNGIGINLFAFNASTFQYLGSTTRLTNSNIRKWLVVNGVLYTAVDNTFGLGGTVLRWKGTLASPFVFETVGNLDSEGAELVAHNNRLYVGTWTQAGPSIDQSAPAGIWQSPIIPSGGLTAAHANSWTKVWRSTDYDPDPVIVLGCGLGGMASFNGQLYFGTLHPFGIGSQAFTEVYGNIGTTSQKQQTAQNSQRATSLFRVTDFASGTPELLYGETQLPRYSPGANGAYGTWVSTPNKMGTSPLYGPSGFGDPLNVYSWSMAVHDNRLFVGTYDVKQGIPSSVFGADLYYFANHTSAAVSVNKAGLSNVANAGIRNMISTDLGLFIGTVNMLNLHPQGGWELIRLTGN